MEYALAFVALYVGILVALSLLVRPQRERLKNLVREMSQERLGDRDRHQIHFMATTAYSWRVAPAIMLAFLLGIVRASADLDRECNERASKSKLLNDPRFHAIVDAYMASAAAVNPIFGALAYAARAVFKLKAVLHHRAVDPRKAADYLSVKWAQ